jgi:rod shape-determining protein MreC
MPFPDIRQRAGYLFLAVAVGHIILISAQVNTQTGVPLLQAFVFGAFSEVQRGTASVVGGVRTSWDRYVALQRVHVDNEELKRRLRDLEVTLQRERASAAESQRLRRLLDLRTHTVLPTRAAEVIATSASADFRNVTINLGTSDGVRKDMAVIVPSGAVGRTVRPAANASRVQLIVDRNAATAVLVESSRAQGIVQGTGEDLLRLEYVSSSAEVAKGDRVLTSGLDGIYPPGFVVGTVVEVEKTGGTFRSIRVRPAVDFSTLDQVLVVTGSGMIGPKPVAPSPTEGPAGQREGAAANDGAARGPAAAGQAGERRP